MSADMPAFTAPPWELTELAGHLDDWTGAQFVIRAPGAPGGLAVMMGGLGLEEERANGHLVRTSPEMYAALQKIYERYSWPWLGALLVRARGENH